MAMDIIIIQTKNKNAKLDECNFNNTKILSLEGKNVGKGKQRIRYSMDVSGRKTKRVYCMYTKIQNLMGFERERELVNFCIF